MQKDVPTITPVPSYKVQSLVKMKRETEENRLTSPLIELEDH